MSVGEQKGLGQPVLSALVSGTVAAALVGGVLKYHLDGRLDEFRGQRAHDVAAFTELVGPAVMNFARSGAAAERYATAGNQFFGDAAILSDANRRMASYCSRSLI